jgi:hypothetical protein
LHKDLNPKTVINHRAVNRLVHGREQRENINNHPLGEKKSFIPACPESFTIFKTDSGQAGMTLST